MQAWRGHGHDAGPATGSDRSECVERTDRAAPGGPSNADAVEGVWAPAATGGDLVSLDEDVFAALAGPLRDVRRRPATPPDR
jgi:hypothetical protein